MILIIGGAGAGKRAYALSALRLAKEDLSDDPFSGTSAVYALQDWVSNHPGRAADALPVLLLKRAVLCDEVGSGVVPMSARERAAREETGRLCIALAREAASVVRVVCGIPQAIKGELP